MKKFLTILLLSGSLVSFGQAGPSSNAPIKLQKGQKVTAVTTMDMSLDMGMAGEIKNNSTSTSTIEVQDIANNAYKISNTLNKIKLNMQMMGQESTYDSEKPADPESELSKQMGERVGKSETGSLDMFTGKFTADKKAGDEEGENPFQAIMSDASGSPSADGGAFFAFPADKKAGDTWTTTNTEVQGVKVENTYKVASIENDVASVSAKSTISINKDVEMQGMSMTVTMNTASEGVFSVNTKTGLVQKRNATSTIEGSMEVGGQSIPMSGKSSNTVEFTY